MSTRSIITFIRVRIKINYHKNVVVLPRSDIS